RTAAARTSSWPYGRIPRSRGSYERGSTNREFGQSPRRSPSRRRAGLRYVAHTGPRTAAWLSWGAGGYAGRLRWSLRSLVSPALAALVVVGAIAGCRDMPA